MKVREIVRKCQFPLILSPGFYALSACISAYIAPELVPYLWLLPLCYILFSGIILAVPGKLLRLLPLGVGCVLFLVPTATLSGDARVLMLAFGLCYSGLLLYSLYMVSWEQTRELGVAWILAVFVLLMIGCFFATYEARLATVAKLIRGSVFVFILLVMLSMNRGSRNLATSGRQGISADMRHKNLFLTLGMFTIALLVALVPSLAKLAEAVVMWIVDLIKRMAATLPEETVPTETTLATEPVTTGEGLSELTDKIPVTPTPKSVYAIMWVVAVGVFLPLLVFAVIRLGKLLWRLLRYFAERINDAVSTEQQDFIDEITDLREERRTQRERNKAETPRATGKNRLTPAAKVRKQYRLLQQQHTYWTEQSTARENLPEEAACIYEKARYSEHPLDEKDVETFKNETQF